VNRRLTGRANAIKLMRGIEGRPGRSVYGGGEARFETVDETIVVRPAFGLDVSAEFPVIRTGPLIEELERDRLVAVLLVRLGGYAAGVFDGDRLLESKVGHPQVHGRHRAGGSSANRFRRRREGEMHRLHARAAEVAEAVLGPWLDRVDAVALGGDREAVRLTIAERPSLAPLAERALPRFLTTPDPRLAILRRVPYDLYAAEVERSGRGV
jgi:Actinobacteria/chloroflexi VLRF1 release factor